MVTPKTKYFLLSCCLCFAIIITLNKTNEGIIYQGMMGNLTERFLFKAAVLRLATTLETPTLHTFPNISKSVVTQASDKGIYIFTAFKRLLPNNSIGVFINGWEDRPLKKPNILAHCCFLVSNSDLSFSLVTGTARFVYNPQLTATLYSCSAPKHIKYSDPFAVSLTVTEKSPDVPVKAVAPIVPPEKSASGSPAKKPAPKKPIKKTIPPGKIKIPNQPTSKQINKNKTDAPIDEKTVNVLLEDTPNKTDSQNKSHLSRKLLSIKRNDSDSLNSYKGENANNQTVNLLAGHLAENKPVVQIPNIVCPTDPSSYVMPYEAIDVNSIDTARGVSDDKVTNKKSTLNEGHVKRVPLGKSASVKAPQREKNFSLAICAKIIYGNPDVELTIEWMEYYKHMGASKVLAFTYNLTEAAKTVIKHYEDSGFLETLPFGFPRPDSPKRNVGQKNAQAWNDEHVTVYHCYDRLINYKFVGIIDFDEFIIPHKDKNFKELFNRLLDSQKSASDFMFQHMVHVQEWNKTRKDDLKIASYLDHTKNLGYNLKAVFLPDRVNEGKVFTHGLLNHRPGFRTIHVLGSIAQLSHYRKKCRPEWVKKKTCFNKTVLRTTRILELVTDNLRTTIEKKKQLLLGIR